MLHIRSFIGCALFVSSACGKGTVEVGPGSAASTSSDTSSPVTGSSIPTTSTGSGTSMSNADTSTMPMSGGDTGLTTESSDFSDLPKDCQPWNDKCPSGSKCLPVIESGSVVGTRCAPLVRDPVGVDEPCTVLGQMVAGDDNCERGSICWYLTENWDGQCVDFCDADFGCADPFSTCETDSSAIFRICSHCDPLAVACPKGPAYSCVPNPSDTGFWCQSTNGAGVTGSSCAMHFDCSKGHFCAEKSQVGQCDGVKCCAAFCDLTASDCPNIDDTCIPWFSPGSVPPPYDKVGRCGPN